MPQDRKADLQAELAKLLWCQKNVSLILDPATRPPGVDKDIEKLARIDGISIEAAAQITADNAFQYMQREIDDIRAKLTALKINNTVRRVK